MFHFVLLFFFVFSSLLLSFISENFFGHCVAFFFGYLHKQTRQQRRTPSGTYALSLAQYKQEVKIPPARPVREEVTDQETFDKECNSGVNCFVSLLDPLNYDAKTHEGN